MSLHLCRLLSETPNRALTPVAAEVLELGQALKPQQYPVVRFATERVVSVNVAAQGGDPELLNL